MAYQRRNNGKTSKRGTAAKKKAPAKKQQSRKAGSQISRNVLPKAKKQKVSVDLMKQLAVVLNPFSGATEHPKIPDGAVTHSLSRRLRNNFSLDMNNDANGWTDIVISPSFGVACTVQNYVPSGMTETPYAQMPSLYGFPGQTVGYNIFQETNGDFRVRANNGEIVKQRLISQGARLSCFNSDNQNDGWFECCRLNIRDSSSNYAFQPLAVNGTLLSDDNGTNAVGCGLDNSFHNGHLQGIALVEQPGYMTGLLKDIHKYDFSLCPSGNEIEFKEQGTLTLKSTEMNITDTTDANGNTVPGRFAALTSSNTNVVPTRAVDRDFDAILIRVYGRHQLSNPSRLLVEAIQNVEFVFANSSDLSSFMTSNDRHEGIQMALDGGPVPAGQRNSRK
jgi:hypothetical protein